MTKCIYILTLPAADGTDATQEELKSCLYKPSSEEWNCMGLSYYEWATLSYVR